LLQFVPVPQVELPPSQRLPNSDHDGFFFPPILIPFFFRPNFFSFLPFRVYFSESRKYTKMASDKAPLPFGYTFMAGERNSNEPRP
jgi:hypothetical protein